MRFLNIVGLMLILGCGPAAGQKAEAPAAPSEADECMDDQAQRDCVDRLAGVQMTAENLEMSFPSSRVPSWLALEVSRRHGPPSAGSRASPGPRAPVSARRRSRD